MNHDATHCPLCGESNQCGQAAGAAQCWCQSVEMDGRRLAELPEAARGRCLCPRCAAEKAAPATGAGDTPRFT